MVKIEGCGYYQVRWRIGFRIKLGLEVGPRANDLHIWSYRRRSEFSELFTMSRSVIQLSQSLGLYTRVVNWRRRRQRWWQRRLVSLLLDDSTLLGALRIIVAPLNGSPNESAPIQLAQYRFPGQACRFQYIFTWNTRKQFYQTAHCYSYSLKLPKCWLQFKKINSFCKHLL